MIIISVLGTPLASGHSEGSRSTLGCNEVASAPTFTALLALFSFAGF